MVRCGLHTGFDAPIGVETARHVVGLGFTAFRLEAKDCDVPTMQAMVQEAVSVGAEPLTVLWDLDRLPFFAGLDCEWLNEMDGDVTPAEYRTSLDLASRIATEHGVRLWGGVISNLDADSLKWLNDVRDIGGGWPRGLHGITAHRYGDGTFEQPHRGFRTRDGEVKWLKAAADGLPIRITEFGYPTVEGDLSEEDAANYIRQEWDFWAGHDIPAYLYQINDGWNTFPIDHYGIRRTDGSWKPAAYTVPKMLQETDTMPATFVLSRRDLIPHPDRAGFFTCRYPKGADTVLCIEPGGVMATRPAGTAGPWETLRDDGTRAVFIEAEDGVYALPLVD